MQPLSRYNIVFIIAFVHFFFFKFRHLCLCMYICLNFFFFLCDLFHFLQAIDPRTRMVLFKMLNRGVFHDINGCISTGKEVCTATLS